jgi:hypothetical protein
VDQRPTVEKDAVRQFLKFVVGIFHELLALHSGLQQRLQHRQQGVCFIESKSLVGHF